MESAGASRGRGGKNKKPKRGGKAHGSRGKNERGKNERDKNDRWKNERRGTSNKGVRGGPAGTLPRKQQAVPDKTGYKLGPFKFLAKTALPPDDQHRMRKLVLSALNCQAEDEIVDLLTTREGLSSLQTIASTRFFIDAGDRRNRHSFQAIAVPFCLLLSRRIAVSANFSGVMKIFSELCRGGATFFTLEEGSAISCLLGCAESPKLIVSGAGKEDTTKFLPATLEDMFQAVLDAIRQLFVNVKDAAKQEKWPEILEELSLRVPDNCMATFTNIYSLVMGSYDQQKRTKELEESAKTVPRHRAVVATDSLPGRLCPTGVRHDNDCEDFRKISVLPTSQEMNSREPPYLPKQYLLHDGDYRGSEFLVDDVERHLDIQFRLLREDMVKTLRSGTQMMADRGGLANLEPGKYRHRLRDGNSIISCAIMRNVIMKGFKPSWKAPLCFEVSFDNPRPNDRKFWDPRVCRLLRKGQLVSVLLDSSRQISLTATVCGDLNCRKNDVRCSVELELVTDTTENIQLVLEYSTPTERPEIGLMEIGGVQIFAYKPVLRALQLQSAGGVPFLRRLVPTRAQPECCTDVLPAFITHSTRFDLSCLVRAEVAVPPELESVRIESYSQLARLLARPHVEESLRMDSTQAQAFAAAFSRDVALIQGPPGTGKTFVGVEILRALLQNSSGFHGTEWQEAVPPPVEEDGKPLLDPIVCITFTNHALDQLLEHLINERIVTEREIVRLGSRSKSEKLSNCSMFARQRDEWTGADGYNKFSYTDEAKPIEAQVEKAATTLSQRPNGTLWSKYVLDVMGQLDQARLSHLKRLLKEEEKNGFQDVDGFGCLAMLRRESLEEYEEYQQVAFDFLVEEINENLKALQKLSDDIERLQSRVKLRVAKKARVIGMTTTGAAMHNQLIKMLRPKVIMCEEAGEVLESHMLSALADRTQSLILIGDHLQLRPKPAEYNLSVESGRGYDLDVSLFERLVMSSTPSVMLLEQRRMQPQISSLLRHTLYPMLLDHPTVLLHPPLKGFARSLMFLDHNHHEAGASDSSSKMNLYEAEMVTALVEYAVRNGYQGSKVAVLTPYLGQLRQIRSALGNKRMTVFVDERTEEELLEDRVLGDGSDSEEDSDELLQTPAEASFSVEKLRDCVRLSTVDNFQGEEADLVIVSTVRCNREGSVGFLATDNRVNVMLSRAKHGMIILGSSQTVMKKPRQPPTMFQTVLRLLEEEGAVVTALPLTCERHPNEVTKAATPDDIPKHGGCNRVCTSRLSCGHRCRSLCHPDNTSHLSIDCREDCQRVLDCGHKCKQLCQAPCKCSEYTSVTLPCGHGKDLPCARAIDFRRNPASVGVLCDREVLLPERLRSLPCGHILEKALCHQVKTGRFTCVSDCGASPWDCGHQCTRPCRECCMPNRPPDHGHCSHPCGRVLLCGHVCTATPCHDANSCPPCQEKCAIRCAHSSCDLPCKESCNPCVERCPWKCTVDHEGTQACSLLCAAACTRPPCDVRCDKVLRCGHPCPSLCGEICPDNGGCPRCAAAGNVASELAGSIVDYISYTELREHTVDDSDPGTCLLQLNCGHVFTVEYLDAKTELENFYEQHNGAFYRAKPFDSFGAMTDKQAGKCDNCPAPLLGPRRYSRCLKAREMHLLDVKWSYDCKVSLAEIEKRVSSLDPNATAKAFNAVKREATGFYNRVVNLNRASPAEKCLANNEVPSAAQTRAAVARAQACAAQCLIQVETIKRKNAQLQPGPVKGKTAADHPDALKPHRRALDLIDGLKKMYEKGIRYASSGLSLTTQGTLNGIFAKGLYQCFELLSMLTATTSHEPSRLRLLKIVDELEQLMGQDLAVRESFVTVLPTMRHRLEIARELTPEEKKSVFAAMAADVGTGIGSYGGHWFECPNGHPYAIGECGGAMEESKCIECGARVGGSRHRLNRDNNVAQSLLSDVNAPMPSARAAIEADADAAAAAAAAAGWL